MIDSDEHEYIVGITAYGQVHVRAKDKEEAIARALNLDLTEMDLDEIEASWVDGPNEHYF